VYIVLKSKYVRAILGVHRTMSRPELQLVINNDRDTRRRVDGDIQVMTMTGNGSQVTSTAQDWNIRTENHVAQGELHVLLTAVGRENVYYKTQTLH